MSQHHPHRPQVPPESTPSRPQPSAADKPHWRPVPYYRVVLLKDGSIDIMFIVRTIMELTRFGRAEATHRMWEAHHSGRSVLLTTYQERAELFAELFAARGLKVTIEAV